MGSMFAMGWSMWLPGLLAGGGLIGVGAWAVSRFAPRSGDGVQILEERLARGEIDAEEFHRRRTVLEGSR